MYEITNKHVKSQIWVLLILSNVEIRKEVRMAQKRLTPEQIIGKLREAEVRISKGEKVKVI